VQCTTFNWPESTGEAVYLRGVFQIKLTNAEMRDGDRVGSKLCTLDYDWLRVSRVSQLSHQPLCQPDGEPPEG
jgi:hypothetical protein